MKSSKEEGEGDEDGEEEGGEEEEGQKGKRFIEKLRRRAVFGAVGHRSVFRRPSTPAHISFDPNNPSSSSKFPPSSRKLAASLWEFYQYYDQGHHHEIPPPPAAKMHRAPYGSADTSNRRLRHGHGKAVVRDNGLDLTDGQPESAGSIRRQIGQMLMKHHQLTERNEPVSPASYDSSLEVAPHNAVVTPGRRRRRRRRRRAGEANYNLKTELLKVVNRIWSLEEQQSDNISLIKALKTELAHSRARIKELLRCQQVDRREMDDLVKQVAEEKLSKETKEHDHRLDDERKLRRRSESLHRKLASELSEAKCTLCDCVKSKKILERLCDEFARGIKSYEREIHGLKQKKLDKKNWDDEQDQDHQMVLLCIAESWLDERIQSGDGALEKLGFEIEAFLKSKEKNHRRSSLEFNALSAPIQEVDSEEEEEEEEEEEDVSNCFELKKHESDDVAKLIPTFGDEAEKQRRRNQRPSSSSLQVKFEDQMAKETNNVVVGEMIRTHRRLSSETQGIDEASCSYPLRRAESPIRHWNPRAVTSDLGVKDKNTLRAKLSEARNKSSRPRVRLLFNG